MTIARENRLPLVNLTESAGADLTRQADVFVPGGEVFKNLAQLSRAGVPMSLRLHCGGGLTRPYLEADIRPVTGPVGVARGICPQAAARRCRKIDPNVTAGVETPPGPPPSVAGLNGPTRL